MSIHRSRLPVLVALIVLAALLLTQLVPAAEGAAPRPTIGITDVRAAEGNAGSTSFTFTVSVSGALKGSASVAWATADGSATSGSDYTVASGPLAFSKTVKSRTVTVLVTGDTTVETDETFEVRLSGAVGATISDGTGIGTIVNDDAVAPPDPVIAVAGDIACDPTNSNVSGANLSSCQQMATSNLLVNGGFAAVLLLGDNQYETGALAAYNAVYDPSWGRVKAITRPAPGNHEYGTAAAAGYYAYFGTVAGDPAQGWYSFDIGSWHLIALNSNCPSVGGCGAGSPQEQWLRADLAAHAGTTCTLAYWHHPRFSSGASHGSSTATAALWAALDAYGADVVLSGHEHNYERFAPQTPTGVASATGIREWVVGTGGRSHYGFSTTPLATSQVRDSTSFGVLKLTLHPAGYDWQFSAASGSFTDTGSGTCH